MLECLLSCYKKKESRVPVEFWPIAFLPLHCSYAKKKYLVAFAKGFAISVIIV